MSKVEHFQSIVKSYGGFILSDGTCNLQHILPKAYDLLEGMEANEELRASILTCFNIEDMEYVESHGLFMSQYHGEATIQESAYESASYVWNEDVYNYFNNIAPSGYYFGSSEGDGACIGWFKIEEEECECGDFGCKVCGDDV
jgi:hypothetical protein